MQTATSRGSRCGLWQETMAVARTRVLLRLFVAGLRRATGHSQISSGSFANYLLSSWLRRYGCRHWQPYYFSLLQADHFCAGSNIVETSATSQSGISFNAGFDVKDYSPLQNIRVAAVSITPVLGPTF